MLLHHFDHLASLTFYVYYMLCRIVFLRYFVFCLSFISHSSCTPHASLSLFLSSFIFLILLGPFVYSCQKGGEYSREYTREYITFVHILRERNSRGGMHIPKGRRHFFIWENPILFCFTLCLCFNDCMLGWSIALLCDHCSHFFMTVMCLIKLCFKLFSFDIYLIISYLLLYAWPLLLALPWRSNVFCASISSYRYFVPSSS